MAIILISSLIFLNITYITMILQKKTRFFCGNGINRKLRFDIGHLKYVEIPQDATASFYIQ